jgi:hypothetical protein
MVVSIEQLQRIIPLDSSSGRLRRIDSVLPRTPVARKMDPSFQVIPRYWMDKAHVDERLDRRGWDNDWLLGWRDIARSTDERTMICSVIPRVAVGDKYLLAFTDKGAELLQANLSSFVLDYVTRQKFAGTSLKYFLVKQLPALPPNEYRKFLPWLTCDTTADWIRARVLELSYTANDLAPFAADLGDDGAPFNWNEERRFVMRAELDAAFFHLYGIERDDVDYIMETFAIVKRKDEQRYGNFRTKELILQVYDAMAEASRTGKPYQTILNPAPGQGLRHG